MTLIIPVGPASPQGPCKWKREAECQSHSDAAREVSPGPLKMEEGAIRAEQRQQLLEAGKASRRLLALLTHRF